MKHSFFKTFICCTLLCFCADMTAQGFLKSLSKKNKTESKESFADLEKKYDGKKAAQAIDDELAALKSELGM